MDPFIKSIKENNMLKYNVEYMAEEIENSEKFDSLEAADIFINELRRYFKNDIQWAYIHVAKN